MDYINQNTIYDYLKLDIPDGYHTMTLGNGVIINFEMLNFTEDKTFTSEDILGDNTADETMLIVKCHGKAVVNKGVTVTPQTRKKGFVLYVASELLNKGNISMTARGACSEGDELLIYGNQVKGYDIVPSEGGSGGESPSNYIGYLQGNKGENGTNRRTGGGGSGAYYCNKTGYKAGSGSSGTSYSGGTGGGAMACYDSPVSAEDGMINGGSGGNASCRRTTNTAWNATGGVGNPSGKDARRSSGAGVANITTTSAESGTGGLLIIYTGSLNNQGSIEANGINSTVYSAAASRCATGGASGGGSVNIFADIVLLEGTITAAGGIAATGGIADGGDGGDGCVTISSMIAGLTDKVVTEAGLAYVVNKIGNYVRSALDAIKKMHVNDISDLEDIVQALTNGIYWSDSVETYDELPDPIQNGETHYVKTTNEYSIWNGVKWIYIPANNVNPVTDTTDGLMRHEDKVILDALHTQVEKNTKDVNDLTVFVNNINDTVLDLTNIVLQM